MDAPAVVLASFFVAVLSNQAAATFLAPPLHIVKVLNVGAEPSAAVGGSVSISLPSPTATLDALAAWKKALLTPPVLLPAPPPPLPRPPKPPPPPPPHHHHRHSHAHGDCCCCCDGSSSSSSGDSSAASSEEDEVASEEARLQRCVRTVAPNMLIDGTYAHVAQMDACAARGMQALAGGAPPAAARDVVVGCMNAAPFPPPLAPFVQDFNECVARVLT